jgi:type I restriction enzyme M protein
MAIKKSDLYASLWASCDQLRGGMDASQYKDYVLFMLFIKYISDKYADFDGCDPPVIIPAGAGFADMVKLKGQSDIGDRINKHIIRPLIDANSTLARSDFPDFNDPNKLGEGQAMVDRISNLIAIFQKPELNFAKNRADHDDILGDAYEYLMRHFATQSGKSKGQFYTPAEVSWVIAMVVGVGPDNARAATTAYDPTCGSGSLLLKVAAQAGTHITLEGQERDVTTAGLARMNMILHGFADANIVQGNTLTNPRFKEGERLRTYDYAVANPPFSDKSWSTGLTPGNDPYQRFAWGEPPAKQGDYAYLLHLIRSLNSTGKGACILPHGVLFRGNAEAVIRRNLVQSGILKGIIGLPANLFYGTGIPACILVLDKENAVSRRGIFMIEASRGYSKDGNKNRLRAQDIHRIVDTFRKQADVPRYARMVPIDEIASDKNDFNLNLPRYIDASEPEDIQDIEGHLKGGIPARDIDALADYWQVLPSLRAALFEPSRPGYVSPRLKAGEVRTAIAAHQEFADFRDSAKASFEQWRSTNRPRLIGFGQGQHPKALIETVSEDLLAAFWTAPLLDAYDIYQHLMDYWAETMQDDCYVIAAEGWKAETHRVREEIKSGAKKGQMRDKGWACDLVPKPLIVARYFAEEQAVIDAMQAELERVDAELEALTDEYGGEGGPLEGTASKADATTAYNEALLEAWNAHDHEACGQYTALLETTQRHAEDLAALADHGYLTALRSGRGRPTLGKVKARLAAIPPGDERTTLKCYLHADTQYKAASKEAMELYQAADSALCARLDEDPLPAGFEDLKILHRYFRLMDERSDLKSRIKAAEDALDQQAHDHYPKLTEAEVQTLVVDDKWLPRLAADFAAELERVAGRLTGRLGELTERYATPLPALEQEVDALAARVAGHLRRMGVEA